MIDYLTNHQCSYEFYVGLSIRLTSLINQNSGSSKCDPPAILKLPIL